MDRDRHFDVGFVGFGEAAQAFVSGWRDSGAPGRALRIAAYDILFDDAVAAADKRRQCLELDVAPLPSAAALARTSGLIVCAVTADQAIAAAESVAADIAGDAAYLDINSVSPGKKRQAAGILATRCGGYVDVAVLAPVHPRRHRTPLLIGGPGVDRCREFLAARDTDFEIVSADVGYASSVKMIRSIFVKGLESVTFECAVAAFKAGLADRVLPSLANVLRFTDAREQADYMMERVAVHGRRRAAEMREVAETLRELDLDAFMAVAAAHQQQAVGDLDLSTHFGGSVPRDAAAIAQAVLEARGDSR